MVDKQMLKKGLEVVYIPSHIKNKYESDEVEYGEVSSWNDSVVFVVYNGDLHSKATEYRDLYDVNAYRAGFLLAKS